MIPRLHVKVWITWGEEGREANGFFTPSRSLVAVVIQYSALAVLQAVALFAAGAVAARIIGTVLLLATIAAVAALRTNERRALAVAVVGVLALVNFGFHLAACPVPPQPRLLQACVAFGYVLTTCAVLVALVSGATLGRCLVAGAVVSACLVTLEAAIERRASTMDPSQVVWVGPAVPHPLLGEFYRPHSISRTLYPDNPRGYFTVVEARAQRWKLETHHEGSAAELLLPPGDPTALRVAITRADVPTPWHIQLNEPGIRVRRGQLYRVRFRVRADEPRMITYGVSQAHAPWDGLGWYGQQEAGPRWHDWFEVFRASGTDDNARLHFDLGESPASVDLAGVEIEAVRTDASIQPRAQTEYSVSYAFNGQGCRGPEYPNPAPPGRRRILVLGDGNALGVGVHEGDTLSARLERQLNSGRAGTPTYEVVNCGVSGYGTREERLLYGLVGPYYRPDVVLLVMDANDDRSRRQDVEQGYVHLPSKYERLFLLWGLVQRARYEGRRPASDFSSTIEEVQRLHADCAQTGARLAVALFRTVPPTGPWRRLAESTSRGLRPAGIPVVDLGATLLAGRSPEELMVHERFDAHPNDIAHRLAAAELERFLTGNHLLDPIPSSTPLQAQKASPPVTETVGGGTEKE